MQSPGFRSGQSPPTVSAGPQTMQPDAHQPENQRWFHIILTTYGAWLPGDPRGFRTRRHREHVEGDYKSPPPAGLYEGLHESARAAQKEQARTFTPHERMLVARWLWDRLSGLGGMIAIIAVAGRHAHLLVKVPADMTRSWVGLCKKHVTFSLKELGVTGKVWAKGAKLVPVKDRAHQLNVYRYIERHEQEGAVVLRYRDQIGPTSGEQHDAANAEP